jgi:hypothetical protein
MSGYVDCDGSYANGCGINLDTYYPCDMCYFIGSVDGDLHTGLLCQEADPRHVDNVLERRGSYWVRVRLEENSGCTSDIRLWARLTVPGGVDYDLYSYTSCSGDHLACSTGDNTIEWVRLTFNDDMAVDDSVNVYLEVRYSSGSSCSSWRLDIWGGGVSQPW